jgi:hypothetical protein
MLSCSELYAFFIKIKTVFDVDGNTIILYMNTRNDKLREVES